MSALFFPPSRSRVAALAAAVVLGGLAVSVSGCAAFLSNPARDARLACEKKDGPSCFVAGNLAMEKDGPNAEAVRMYIRGCSVRHSPSCDALDGIKGPLREQALVGGCNAGDLVSCAKRANELVTTASNVDEARGLRHQVCKKSVTLSSGSPARELEGVAESCASLARMVAAGEGGGRDATAAAKLQVLAQTLRNEALYRHEREDDGKQLPAPAVVQPPPPRRKGSVKRAPKVDPAIAERAKFRTEYEARRDAREAWMSAVQASITSAAQQKDRGNPSIPTPTPLERATSVLSGGGASSCQRCVAGCGSMSTCVADDFAGGSCGYLRCAAPGPCPDFDACVAECTAKAEACSSACGECATAKAGKQ